MQDKNLYHYITTTSCTYKAAQTESRAVDNDTNTPEYHFEARGFVTVW